MTNVLIIEARFYDHIADLLLQGAEKFLQANHISYQKISVPGALEIPAALNFALKSDRSYDAYITLGCIIRGETSHYDIVCHQSAQGIYKQVLDHGLALGNGILTVENEEQALERADPLRKNKGAEAAKASLCLLEIKHNFQAKDCFIGSTSEIPESH